MAGSLSSEFTQTFILLQTFTIIDSTIAGVQHNFYSLSHSPIMDPFSSSITSYARVCSVNIHLAELTLVGEPNCIHGKKFSRVEG